MDTIQLMNIVKSPRSLEPYFRGIYICNTLPNRVRRFPSAYIVTRIPSKKRAHIGSPTGSPVSTSEFFDSFGPTPEVSDQRLRDFVDRNSLLCLYTNVQVQPDSTNTCGLYALYYLNARARGISMSNILNMTSKTEVRNVLLKQRIV